MIKITDLPYFFSDEENPESQDMVKSGSSNTTNLLSKLDNIIKQDKNLDSPEFQPTIKLAQALIFLDTLGSYLKIRQ